MIFYAAPMSNHANKCRQKQRVRRRREGVRRRREGDREGVRRRREGDREGVRRRREGESPFPMVTLPTPAAEQRSLSQAPAPRVQPDALTLGHCLDCRVELASGCASSCPQGALLTHSQRPCSPCACTPWMTRRHNKRAHANSRRSRNRHEEATGLQGCHGTEMSACATVDGALAQGQLACQNHRFLVHLDHGRSRRKSRRRIPVRPGTQRRRESAP